MHIIKGAPHAPHEQHKHTTLAPANNVNRHEMIRQKDFVIAVMILYFVSIFVICCYYMCCGRTHTNHSRPCRSSHGEELIKEALVSKMVRLCRHNSNSETNEDAQLMGIVRCKEKTVNINRSTLGCAVNVNVEDNSDLMQCYICFEPFVIGDCVSWAKGIIQCQHVFHTSCIVEWLRNHNNCPCCRANIMYPETSRRRTWKFWIQYDKESENFKAQYCIIHGLVFPAPINGSDICEGINISNSDNS